MVLSAGDKLGPYEILSALGAGGMGEVYKARDTRLDRFVAIKVLPDHIAKREDLRARFEREARAVASLNHAHICVLHDIGPNYMVLELIEGETLEVRIQRGALTLDAAITYATQIADALDRAHRAGVTHRDIKPGNIMLTRDGVKILDFGLAKSTPKPGPTDATAVAMLTIEGTVLGTPQYMAPEQFEGKEADARADIWAFGAVLYEMVTGRKAFEGKNYTSLVAAILGTNPPPMAVKPFTPTWLERLVKRCLQKDPEDRYLAMHDIVLDLKSPPVESTPTATRSSRWPWVLAALLGAALVSVSVIHFRQQAPPATPIRFTVSLPEGTTSASGGLSVSPDGKSILFRATGKDGKSFQWLRELGSLTPSRQPGDSGWDLCWSADSKAITYMSESYQVVRRDAAGGEPRALSKAMIGLFGSNQSRGLACSPQAVLIGSSQGPLFQMPPSGGEVKPLTKLDSAKAEVAQHSPQFLPGGVRFLFTVLGGSAAGIYAGSLDSPEVRRILPVSSRALYVSNGYLLYQLGRALVAQRFDPTGLNISGDPVRIVDGLQWTEREQPYAWFSASPDVLAYRADAQGSGNELVWYDRTGKRLGEVGPPGAYTNPALSPDGRRLAVGRGNVGARDIWVTDLARGTDTRLTFDEADELNPVWSPDGEEIFFTSQRTGARRLFRKSASGVGEEHPLEEGGLQNSAESISPDGKTLTYNSSSGVIWMIATGGGKPQLVKGPRSGNATHSAISPDGRFIAYSSDESGQWQVFVQHFPFQGKRWQISVAGGREPAWRADGGELYYRLNRTIMAARIAIAGDSLQPGAPAALFDAPMSIGSRRNEYVATRDGSRFLIISERPRTGNTACNVVLHWAAGLPK